MTRPPKEVTEEQIRKAIAESRTVLEAAKKLGIAYKTLFDRCQKYKIPWPDYQKDRAAKLSIYNRASEKAPFVKDDGRDVVCWVSPEERDYYYNMDFLCGTHHGPKKNKKEIEAPYHGLGFGEDE